LTPLKQERQIADKKDYRDLDWGEYVRKCIVA